MENIKTSLRIGENKMTTISEEEENYVRMSLLLSGISPRAVRVLLDNEFHPLHLNVTIKKETNKLSDLKKKKLINQSQWEILFPRNGVPDSNMFDITLMITLLTNLTGLNHYDKLPLVTDITVAADLGRMKYYRNLIAHNKDGKLETTFFSQAWNDISGAVCRLGGQSMLDECKQLRTKILEQSTVPWNIRDQISTTLEAWTLDDSNLVETKAANYVLKCIQEHSCVTITASSGVGKTVTLRHVALQMKDDGYNVLPVTNPHDIVKFNNPNEKTLFVMDDFCGTYSLNQSDVNNFGSVMKSIKELLIQNVTTKIIVACRLQVYQDEKFEFLSIFRTCECNLLSEDLCLSQTEKQSIAELYLKEKTSDIIRNCDLYDCFPLLCKLYNENPKPNITYFFQNRFSVYRLEIDKLHTNGHFGKYCALALCVMLNNSLSEDWFTDEMDKEKRKRIKNTCEACRLDRGTSRLILLDEMNSLILTFITKEQDVYKTIHDKIFDFLAFYFGHKMIQCLIKNADIKVIGKRFLLEKKDGMDQYITTVPYEYHKMYIQRMIDDWSKGKVLYVFDNINLMIPEFRQRFLRYLNKLDISFQRQLALTCDVPYEDTALSCCCFLSDIPLIKWCINHGVDVNKCRYDGLTPLIIAADKGRKEIVKLLLDNKANINKCRYSGSSPMYAACQNNNIEVVKVLLDNKADIDKFRDGGISPLCIACDNNYLEIVKLLLESKPNIDNSWSSLFMACQNNHIEIAKLLLEHLGNVLNKNKSIDWYWSSLLVACNLRHIDIVKVLLDSKADIAYCAQNGMSSLIYACGENFITCRVVNVLIESQADINKCTDNGESPLFIACQNYRLELVNVLLNNKAEVNKCDKFGASPLFIACQNNHIEIVNVLLDNKANINKCKGNGASPLFVSYMRHHKGIVSILVQKGADCNNVFEVMFQLVASYYIE